ncbi:MAG: AAA family ATPase [Spirochaetota bacterium]|nr:AAA family ATPase [Spirochaetota bacterium]
MDSLTEKFRRKISGISTRFVRSVMGTIHWDARLIGIKGARGVGKTTLLLQHIKLTYYDQLDRVLYVSMDDLWFSEHSLPDLVDQFVRTGGEKIYLDEVHKYPDWSRAIKNIYDDYPELRIVFTASSLLEILDARADLSRRAVVYHLPGLSFREYLNIQGIGRFKTHTLEEIIHNHSRLSEEIVKEIKPFQFFQDYLQAGYYPFFLEGKETFSIRLEETLIMLLEVELPLLRNIDLSYVIKLKQLLSIISESAPFVPNISRLSDRIGINRHTLINYLHYLTEARLINSLYKQAPGIGALKKPDKLFLENTNLMYLLAGHVKTSDKGTVRETFFFNQIGTSHELVYPEQADFLVDGKYTFEIGGRNKGKRQIRGIEAAYVAVDDIEYGYGRTIPLWLFGFLY